MPPPPLLPPPTCNGRSSRSTAVGSPTRLRACAPPSVRLFPPTRGARTRHAPLCRRAAPVGPRPRHATNRRPDCPPARHAPPPPPPLLPPQEGPCLRQGGPSFRLRPLGPPGRLLAGVGPIVGGRRVRVIRAAAPPPPPARPAPRAAPSGAGVVFRGGGEGPASERRGGGGDARAPRSQCHWAPRTSAARGPPSVGVPNPRVKGLGPLRGSTTGRG